MKLVTMVARYHGNQVNVRKTGKIKIDLIKLLYWIKYNDNSKKSSSDTRKIVDFKNLEKIITTLEKSSISKSRKNYNDTRKIVDFKISK